MRRAKKNPRPGGAGLGRGVEALGRANFIELRAASNSNAAKTRSLGIPFELLLPESYRAKPPIGRSYAYPLKIH